MAKQAREILETWFAGCDNGLTDEATRRWFSRDEAFDSELRTRFGGALDLAAKGELGAWCITPHGSLAFVILCDQIARNIHRGTARAYATDAFALHECLGMLARGEERELNVCERHFLLMPLMHSEDLAMHDLALREFTRFRDQAPQAFRSYTENVLQYEEKHRALIVRFGRYPQRNEALGRPSTDEEKAFLAGPGNRF
ncbi:MAG: DUF924 family protein [Polyangiales bacterium]